MTVQASHRVKIKDYFHGILLKQKRAKKQLYTEALEGQKVAHQKKALRLKKERC